MNNIEEKLFLIDSLKNRIDKSNQFYINNFEFIKIEYFSEIIYNSKLAKGNSLTIKEIASFLLDGKKVAEKPENEYIQIEDHKNALDYIERLSNKKMIELNITDILNIHLILMKNTIPDYAGKYRTTEAWITLHNGEKVKTCDPSLLKCEMDNYFYWFLSEKSEHPIIFAAEAHNRFVGIHPFIDGNGRAGRLIMNLILMQNGFLPVIIKSYKRTEYYDNAIISWKNGNKEDFYSYIIECEKSSLNRFLEKAQTSFNTR